MPRLFIAVILMIAAVSGARALEPVSVTIDSVSSTSTIQGISISSASATSVVVSTSPLYRQVCVQNFDTAAFLACSENVNVSTLTASGLIGAILAPASAASSPAAPMCFSIPAGTNFYCRTSSVTGTTRAGIGRGR